MTLSKRSATSAAEAATTFSCDTLSGAGFSRAALPSCTKLEGFGVELAKLAARLRQPASQPRVSEPVLCAPFAARRGAQAFATLRRWSPSTMLRGASMLCGNPLEAAVSEVLTE
ncbi:MAG: hypothetical protein EOQ54_14005 [Mesorhizobium sp.]|nr:MAG: hypothetical protein EOQ54_14005 [Mesorhizobium sp.]